MLERTIILIYKIIMRMPQYWPFNLPTGYMANGKCISHSFFQDFGNRNQSTCRIEMNCVENGFDNAYAHQFERLDDPA
jgi:hypothetical protein